MENDKNNENVFIQTMRGQRASPQSFTCNGKIKLKLFIQQIILQDNNTDNIIATE